VHFEHKRHLKSNAKLGTHQSFHHDISALIIRATSTQHKRLHGENFTIVTLYSVTATCCHIFWRIMYNMLFLLFYKLLFKKLVHFTPLFSFPQLTLYLYWTTSTNKQIPVWTSQRFDTKYHAFSSTTTSRSTSYKMMFQKWFVNCVQP